MFLTCCEKECNFFLWIDQPMSQGIKERLSYSPLPQITRFHPYGEMKEIFEKEAKQKAFIQHQRHTREDDEGCDNGFNSLGSPNIVHVIIYREWIWEVWESGKVYIRKMKEDSPGDPDPTLSLEMCCVRRITNTQGRTVIIPKVTEC